MSRVLKTSFNVTVNVGGLLMRLAALLFMLCLLIGLPGCATTPAPLPDIRYVAVLPDDDFIKDCDLQPPPDKTTYLSSDANGREDLLTQAYKGATTDGIVCNARLKRVREWKAQQQKLYPSAASTASP